MAGKLTKTAAGGDPRSSTPKPSSRLSSEMRRRSAIDASSSGTKTISRDDGKCPSHSWIDHIFSSLKNVFVLCLVFRFVNALLVQTYFNPDEHWQSLEVAHSVVFGYGHLTWEWKRRIRSYIHPLIFALLYRGLALFQLDNPWIMVRAPRLLQSFFAAVGDLYLYRLSGITFNEQVARWALFCQFTNWFTFYCFPRTLSNNMETVLTLVSLYHWPTFRNTSNHNSRKVALMLAALACAIRPTSAVIWLYVGMIELLRAHDTFTFLFGEVVPIGAAIIGFTTLLDRWMFGSWAFVPFNFLKFNFFSSGGDYYGTHKWYWYFTEGFPAMTFSFLPFSLMGAYQSKQWKLFGLVVWVLAIYSFLGHKEFRFVLPVLPIALIFSGYSLATMANSQYKIRCFSKLHVVFSSKIWLAVLFLLATNLPMALYMSLVHQRGSEDAMNFLAKEAVDGKVKSVLFLMPCHSTPYYSTLHQDLPMRFLDCSPRDYKGSLDESDQFMMDPVNFMTTMMSNWTLPSHIVLFDFQAQLLRNILISHSFKEVKRFFHAHFKVDRELQKWVILYAHG